LERVGFCLRSFPSALFCALALKRSRTWAAVSGRGLLAVGSFLFWPMVPVLRPAALVAGVGLGVGAVVDGFRRLSGGPWCLRARSCLWRGALLLAAPAAIWHFLALAWQLLWRGGSPRPFASLWWRVCETACASWRNEALLPAHEPEANAGVVAPAASTAGVRCSARCLLFLGACGGAALSLCLAWWSSPLPGWHCFGGSSSAWGRPSGALGGPLLILSLLAVADLHAAVGEEWRR
jgi:hypothetical protein